MSQNRILQKADSAPDLRPLQNKILARFQKLWYFRFKKYLWQSVYHASDKVAAFSALGAVKNKKVVLKIQGPKLETDEDFLIKAFHCHNKSSLITAPPLLKTQKRSPQYLYDAYLTPYITPRKLIRSGKTNSPATINRFFTFYKDYRTNCCSVPFVPPPPENSYQYIQTKHTALFKRLKDKIEAHPLHKKEDLALHTRFLKLAQKHLTGIPMPFCHAHLAASDLFQKKGKIYLFSHIYWGYRPPLFDAVFASHWSYLNMQWLDNLNSQMAKAELNRWYKIASKHLGDSTKLRLAFLERHLAGLLFDMFFLHPTRPQSQTIMNTLRTQSKKLLSL